MFNTPEELRREWDLSDELVADIVPWARAWHMRDGHPDHDTQAAQLVRRITRELNVEVDVVYKP